MGRPGPPAGDAARGEPSATGAGAWSFGVVAFGLSMASSAASCAEWAVQAGPVRAWPDYTARAAELFDDAVEPTVVGYPADDPGRRTGSANVLAERVRTADAVVRARVVTVTSKQETIGLGWQVGLHAVEHLAGPRPLSPTDDFTIHVSSVGRAAGIFRAFEGQLVGTTLVAFVREFAGKGSEPELHFHAAPDVKGDVEAIRAAAFLGPTH